MITVSESAKRNISETLSIPEHKIKVIYLGVADNFKPLDKKLAAELLDRKYGIAPFILHISAYQPKKNVEGIIKAFAIAKRKYKIPHKLVISGKQPKSLKKLSNKLGVGKDVIFVGFIAEDELPLFYSAADAFIFPSLHESFGMPILEAMACGTPVITSNVFSMPEIAGKAAILVNPYNHKEIADAIYKVVGDEKLRRKLAKLGIERAKQFTWKKCAKEHLNVYMEAIT